MSSSSNSRQEVAAPNRSSWFADFRTKLNQFSAVDFFSNLGFTSRHTNLSGTASRKSSIFGRGGPSIGGTAVSCSVMNLASTGDSIPTIIGDRQFDNDAGETPTSIQHHSDGPRRRLIVGKSMEDAEEATVLIRPKQQSEPPISRLQKESDKNYQDDEPAKSSFSDGSDDAAKQCTNITSDFDTLHFGTLTGLIIAGKTDPGVGHDFNFTSLGYPTWCDKCGDFISGLNERQAVKCENCRFTCHVQCQNLVTLDCRSENSLNSEKASSPLAEKAGDGVGEGNCTVEDAQKLSAEQKAAESEDLPAEPAMKDALNCSQLDLPRDDQLRRLVDGYNELYSDGLSMTMEEDGETFRGFLQVHMNFNRPINVVSGEHPLTIYDVISSENDGDVVDTQGTSEGRKTITSFYLPRNTVKVLHVTSETSTSQMIASLLKKFKVADNPRKFALYERDLEPGETLQARLSRIPEDTCPLKLALLGASEKKKIRFVLQENETGDIMWDAFEIPELHNFLKILDIEEHQYMKQIEQRYCVYRYWLEAEIRHRMAQASFTMDSLA